MPKAPPSGRAAYEQARTAFEKLETQDKVAFAVEAAFGAVGQSIEAAGRQLASVLDDLAGDAAQAFSSSPPEPGASEPTTAEPPGDEQPATGGARRATKKSGSKKATGSKASKKPPKSKE